MVLALAGDSTTTTFMKIRSVAWRYYDAVPATGVGRNMGNSPPPVKSLPDLEAGLASGIIFAVSSLWPNSGRPEGWPSRHSPTSPLQGRAIVYDSERAASASLPLKRGGMGWGSRPPPPPRA